MDSHIKRANKFWYISAAHEARLDKISDTYDDVNNKFLSYPASIQKFGNVMDIITYARLITSLPTLWKLMLRQRIIGERTPVGLEKLPPHCKLSKYIYWTNVEKLCNMEEDPCITMWSTELNINVTL